MPTLEELYKSQMTWPRLILKGAVESILCYNFYDYATTHRTAWDCYATDKKQPNDVGLGINITEQFTAVIYAGFILSLVGCGITFLEIVNKKLANK